MIELPTDWILVDDGEIFEGSRDTFRDCFFDNADNYQIIDFCRCEGWKLEINGTVMLGRPTDN